MSNPEDERSATRFEKDITVFVDLESGLEADSESKIVICNSFDLSGGGLQLVLDRDIPQGNILRLCLDIKDRDPLFVVARVKWTRKNEESGDYNVGFQLLNSKGTDFESWLMAISEIFPVAPESL